MREPCWCGPMALWRGAQACSWPTLSHGWCKCSPLSCAAPTPLPKGIETFVRKDPAKLCSDGSSYRPLCKATDQDDLSQEIDNAYDARRYGMSAGEMRERPTTMSGTPPGKVVGELIWWNMPQNPGVTTWARLSNSGQTRVIQISRARSVPHNRRCPPQGDLKLMPQEQVLSLKPASRLE